MFKWKKNFAVSTDFFLKAVPVKLKKEILKIIRGGQLKKLLIFISIFKLKLNKSNWFLHEYLPSPLKFVYL